MQETDRKRFKDLLEQAGAVYCEDVSHRYRPYWDLLKSRLAIDAFAAALEQHMADPDRGRFFPRPADLLGAAPADGRPAADEAWSIAVASRDEAETVCWTAEIAEACGVAAPILDLGDRVGARMAFLAAYGRLVDGARRAGRPVAWSLSVGHDRERRAAAAERAVRQGLMAPERVAHLLPQPEAQGPIADVARMLTGKVVAHPARADGEYRQRMAALRAAMLGGEDAAPARDLGDGLSPRDREILAALEQRRA